MRSLLVARGRPSSSSIWATVPPCLEVCNDGLCTGNIDRSQSYANGHPNERDANLPVDACWHINYQEMCPGSNFSEIIISRKSDPPPRSFSGVLSPIYAMVVGDVAEDRMPESIRAAKSIHKLVARPNHTIVIA